MYILCDGKLLAAFKHSRMLEVTCVQYATVEEADDKGTHQLAILSYDNTCRLP